MFYVTLLNPALDVYYETAALNPGGTQTGLASKVFPAGKGINVAKVLATLVANKPTVDNQEKNDGLGIPNNQNDQSSRAVQCGTDDNAVCVIGLMPQNQLAQFEQYLAKRNIQSKFVPAPGDVRVNATILETATGEVTHLNSQSTVDVSTYWLELKKQVMSCMQPGDVWILSGSLPLGAPMDGYAQLITQLKAAGCLTILDTSGAPLVSGVLAGPHSVKPNLFELKYLASQLTSQLTIHSPAKMASNDSNSDDGNCDDSNSDDVNCDDGNCDDGNSDDSNSNDGNYDADSWCVGSCSVDNSSVDNRVDSGHGPAGVSNKMNYNNEIEVARRILNTVKTVFISLGDQGLLGVSDAEGSTPQRKKLQIYHCPVPKNVNVVDTVGCGDAAVAGIAMAQAHGLSLTKTCKLAGACGISNATQKGPGNVVKADVEKYIALL